MSRAQPWLPEAALSEPMTGTMTVMMAMMSHHLPATDDGEEVIGVADSRTRQSPTPLCSAFLNRSAPATTVAPAPPRPRPLPRPPPPPPRGPTRPPCRVVALRQRVFVEHSTGVYGLCFCSPGARHCTAGRL